MIWSDDGHELIELETQVPCSYGRGLSPSNPSLGYATDISTLIEQVIFNVYTRSHEVPESIFSESEFSSVKIIDIKIQRG